MLPPFLPDSSFLAQHSRALPWHSRASESPDSVFQTLELTFRLNVTLLETFFIGKMEQEQGLGPRALVSARPLSLCPAYTKKSLRVYASRRLDPVHHLYAAPASKPQVPCSPVGNANMSHQSMYYSSRHVLVIHRSSFTKPQQTTATITSATIADTTTHT